MDTQKAKQVVESLKPDLLRQRLDELEAEEKALRVLLRAAVARDRQAARNQRGATA